MIMSGLPELSLDLSPPVARISEDLIKLNEFIKGLEDELTKIDAFKRELPLSFLLLTDAIGKLKEQARKLDECGGAKLGYENSSDDGYDQFDEKSSWLSSAQLWCPRKKEEEERERKACKVGGEGGAFRSFKGGDSGSGLTGLSLMTNPPPVAIEPGLRREQTGVLPSSVFYTVVNDQTVKPQTTRPLPYHQTARKQRRCWSPELHRRFVDALEKLGGSQVATPKQIRELMQVDGLTNDEVKSHLQKYRLHIRKLPASSRGSPGSSTDVAMGGDQLELGCFKMEVSHSGSPEGPLHFSRSGKSNSSGMEEEDEEEKSDGHSWKVQQHE